MFYSILLYRYRPFVVLEKGRYSKLCRASFMQDSCLYVHERIDRVKVLTA